MQMAEQVARAGQVDGNAAPVDGLARGPHFLEIEDEEGFVPFEPPVDLDDDTGRGVTVLAVMMHLVELAALPWVQLLAAARELASRIPKKSLKG